ncbi:MAG: collagen-like protein [Lachnospiraceae bacterium]|nr:collagen-like protein [Lachnospiraceae bacterium]
MKKTTNNNEAPNTGGFFTRERIIKIGVLVAVLIIILGRYAYKHFKAEKTEDSVSYSNEEQVIYDATQQYLNKTLGLEAKDCAAVADEAVKNYDMIIDSGVKAITDDHVAAITTNISKAMFESLPVIDEMSQEETIGLSSDITEIIWNDILWQIASMDKDKAKDYNLLFDSIQKSLSASKNGKLAGGALNVSIKDVSVDPEMILASVKKMSDSQVEDLKERLDVMNESNRVITATVNVPSQSLKNDSSLVGRDGRDGQDGKDGRDGAKGATGATGARGERGEKGEAGAKGDAGEKGEKGETGEKGEDGVGGYVDGQEATYMIEMDTTGSSSVVTFTPTIK